MYVLHLYVLSTSSCPCFIPRSSLLHKTERHSSAYTRARKTMTLKHSNMAGRAQRSSNIAHSKLHSAAQRLDYGVFFFFKCGSLGDKLRPYFMYRRDRRTKKMFWNRCKRRKGTQYNKLARIVFIVNMRRNTHTVVLEGKYYHT